MAQVLTNEYGLPQILYDAMSIKDYDPVGASDYSATSLISPPRIVQLNKRHKDEVQEDVLDWWARFKGTAIHSALEKGLKPLDDRYIIERKITRFDKPEGATEDKFRRVVAKLDAYDKETQTLSDHKTTTTFIHGNEMKDEWINQLNINAYFLEKDGYSVKNVAINAIYMDWRPTAGRYKDEKYPAIPCYEFLTEAWPMEKREQFYKERLALHVAAEDLSDEDLPECTSEEMWEKAGCFAVYKPGAQKATRLCPSREDAELYIQAKGLTGYKIEDRPGERTRCERYCSCRDFCSQYKKYIESKYAIE